MVFLSILQEELLPCPVHPALFHNFGCCYIILMGTKKIKIKMNNSIQLAINGNLKIFCAALGADPAILKTGCQALVCQFLPNLYTNFTKLSNTPLIRKCALICTNS